MVVLLRNGFEIMPEGHTIIFNFPLSIVNYDD